MSLLENFRNFYWSISLKKSSLLNPNRDYIKAWVGEEGRQYRENVYNRQKEGGGKPLIANPKFEEVKRVLKLHSPQSVLEVGCGWGRLLKELRAEFYVEGCDVSDDMLKLCPSDIKVFKLDIIQASPQFLKENLFKWDVIFTRGVMLYFCNSPLVMDKAMHNLIVLANKKIIVWEWPEVCGYMKSICKSEKFDYRPIKHLNE